MKDGGGGFKDPAGVWVRIVYCAKEFNKAVCTEQKMTTVLWGHCLLFSPLNTQVSVRVTSVNSLGVKAAVVGTA